jgi:DNA-binding transcriptional regulator YhcF (GntR family)
VFEFQTKYPGVGNLHEHLAGDLIRGIAEGQLRPGGKLPTTKQLAGEYRYSVPVVRQATGTLKRLGLVTVVKRSQGTVVLAGAVQIARRHLRERERGKKAVRRGSDIEVRRPSGNYTKDEPPRSVVPFSFAAAYSLRRPTDDELNAGRYDVDELVVDVVSADGTVESYGIFHTTFKVPAIPPVAQ